MTLFEKATRKKLRFSTSVGKITVEDLWDLSLERLDKIAQELHALVRNGETVSFIDAPNTSASFKKDKLKFDVVKRIIEVRLEDKQEAEKVAAEKAKRKRIMHLIDKKKEKALEEKSLEELEALLANK